MNANGAAHIQSLYKLIYNSSTIFDQSTKQELLEYLVEPCSQIYPLEEDKEMLALHRIHCLKWKLFFFLVLVQLRLFHRYLWMEFLKQRLI